jgi:tetratricopeptide (TPR) repeat protein
MDELISLIKNDKLIEAEELFLNSADMLFGLGEYDKLHKLAECFPEKYRRNRMLLEFFFHSSIHFISPYAAREKLFELISLFEIKKNYDRIADIYITLLINYTYHCEESVEPLRLSDITGTFIKKNKKKLSANKIVKLSLWIQITRIWYRSGDIRIQDVGYEIERIAFELKDSFALIVIRIFQANNYNRNGKFKSALQEFDKAERIVRNRKANETFGPFISFWKSDTYFQMRLFSDMKKEVEKGLALADEQSIFYDYLKPYLFLYHVFMRNYAACEEIKESILFGKLSKNEFFRNHFLYLGEMLLSYFAGQKEKVVYYCSKIIPIKETEFYYYVWPLSRINFAEFNLYAGNYDVVQKTLNDVLEMTPEEEHTNLTLGAHALLSIMYDRINDRKKAERHFKRMGEIIIEAKPEEVPILNNTLLQEIAEKSKNTTLQKLLRKRTINETIDYPVSSDAVKNSVRSDNHNVEIRAFGELRFFVDSKKISSSIMDRQKLKLKIIKLLITNYDTGVSRDVFYNIFNNTRRHRVIYCFIYCSLAEHFLESGIF